VTPTYSTPVNTTRRVRYVTRSFNNELQTLEFEICASAVFSHHRRACLSVMTEMQAIDIAPPPEGGLATKGSSYVPLEVRQKRLCVRCGGVVTVTTVIVLMLIAFTAGKHSRVIHGKIRDAVTGTHPSPPAGKGMGESVVASKPMMGASVGLLGKAAGVQLAKGLGSPAAKGFGSPVAKGAGAPHAKGIGAPLAKGAGAPPGKGQGSPATAGAAAVHPALAIAPLGKSFGKGPGTMLAKGGGGPFPAGGASAPVPDEEVIKSLSEDIGKSLAGEE